MSSGDVAQVRVLIVDDDQAILDYMQVLLERDGFFVKVLDDPTKVEAELKNQYHLVILDMMMPKMDGIETLERIRRLDDDLAVIVYTGFPNLDNARATMRLGALDYLSKPFNVDEFRQVLERVLRKKGLSRTPEEQLYRIIGERIRTLRKEKDLTLSQLHKRTGLSISLLSQIERSESAPSISSLYKIAAALESRMGDLFGPY
jgi:two-component system, OmpR family, response regulator